MTKTDRLLQAFTDAGDFKMYEWLPKNYSQAFVICIGAGPWKYKRRTNVQVNALTSLGSQELEELNEHIDWYPLGWQNRFVSSMAAYLRGVHTTMNAHCYSLIEMAKKSPLLGLSLLYDSVGSKSKTVSLFARDALKIPAFPIDRHVLHWLKKYDLPIHESDLIQLCFEVGLDPREVATAFVQTGLDVGNANHQ